MSMNKNAYLYNYFRNSLYFLFTHDIFVLLHLIIEYIDIYTYALDAASQLFLYNHPYTIEDNLISKYLFYLSPYYHFIQYCKNPNNSSNMQKEISILALFFLLSLWVIMLYKQIVIKLSKITYIQSFLIRIYVNFYDYLFFRTFAIIPINIINENFFAIINQTKLRFTIVDIILLILISCFAVITIWIYINYYLTFNIWSTFKFNNSCFNAYPFDNYFSMKYDICLLIVKVLITLSHNYLETHNKIVTSFQLFINGTLLFIIFALSFRIFYHFFINNHNLILFLLNKGNILRVFLLEFTSVSIVLRIMFNKKDSVVLFGLFSILSSLFLLYLIICNYNSFILSNAEMSNNYLGICWFFQSNDMDRNKFITQWIIHHKTLCSNSKCGICLELHDDWNNKCKGNCIGNSSSVIEEEKKVLKGERIFSPYKFVITLNDERKKSNHKILDRSEQIRNDFIYLTVLFLSSNQQLFKLYSIFSKLFVKYQDAHDVLLSLLMCFELTRKANNEVIKTYKLIRKSENLMLDLYDYIKNFESFIYYEAKTPENFLKISDRFDKIKENCNTIIELIKKDTKCNYQTRIVRYLYENVLKTPLKILHNESEIISSEEFLTTHYQSDKLLLLQYSIERSTFTILKGSKDMLKYKNQPFDSIFPDNLKRKGLELFNSKLQNNNPNDAKNLYSFIIKDLHQPEEYDFIQDFKMLYSIYPSNSTNEILITINYGVDYEDILIFEIPLDNGEEYLYSCSRTFFKILGLTPEIIHILSKANLPIVFEDLFLKQSFNLQNESCNCLLQYARYAKIYKDLIKCDALNESVSYKEMKDIASKITEFGNKKKELSFTLSEKIIDENPKSKFIVYTVLELSKNHQETRKNHKNTMTINAIENDLLNEPLLKFDNLQTTSAPTISGFSSASVASSSQHLSSGLNGKKSHKEERKERYKQVHHFTLLILFYGLLLMCLTMIFLILEINENLTFQTLFQLFQSFKYFKRHLECIPLSIFSNFCLENEDGTCVNYYQQHSINIKNEYKPMSTLPLINDVIKAEVASKINAIMDNYNIFLYQMHKLNFDSINKIGLMQVTLFDIKIIKNDLIIDNTNSTLNDLVRSYSNYITALLTNDAYIKESVRLVLISAEGKIYSENTEITDMQRNIYRLLLNYPSIHKGILDSSHIIETCFTSYLHEINNILMGFFFPLLCLHIILCIIAVWFLRLFIQMIRTIIGEIYHLFSDQLFLNFIEKRINSLKILCETYKDDPMKIINKITFDEENYKRKLKEMNLSQKIELQQAIKQNLPPQIIQSEYNASEKEFNKIIIKYRISIIILFIIYIIYSIAYYIFLNAGYLKLTYLVNYCSINTLIDTYIYDNVFAMQYIAITNSTPFDLGLKIYGNSSIDYVEYGIDQLYTVIKAKETIEKKHHILFPPLSEKINLNCSEGIIQDPTFTIGFDNIGSDFSIYFKTLCDYYKIHSFTSDTNLIKEILYLLKQVSYKYFQGNYAQLISYYMHKTEYDIYTQLLIFNRVIRTYFNETIFKEEVSMVLNYFTTLIIVYLVLNMCLEIIIFLILNFFVINRIRVMNKKLSQFINAFKCL